MPKETIWGKRYIAQVHEADERTGRWINQLKWDGDPVDKDGKPLPRPANEHLVRSPSIEVYWARPEERPIFAYDEVAEGVVQLGLDVDRFEALEWAMRLEKDEDITSTALITEGLTRSQINHLIKILKKARDQAFGADE